MINHIDFFLIILISFNVIVRTDEWTDGRVVCKIVFSITFNVRFWCSKEPSHREDSFEHQKCLSENIIVDLRIISKLTSKLNIKKRDRVCPPAKCHLNGFLLADQYWSKIVCWLGLFVRTFRRMDKLNIF